MHCRPNAQPSSSACRAWTPALPLRSLFRNVEEIEKLSELGVLFLLFEMGLELTIDKLQVRCLGRRMEERGGDCDGGGRAGVGGWVGGRRHREHGGGDVCMRQEEMGACWWCDVRGDGKNGDLANARSGTVQQGPAHRGRTLWAATRHGQCDVSPFQAVVSGSGAASTPVEPTDPLLQRPPSPLPDCQPAFSLQRSSARERFLALSQQPLPLYGPPPPPARLAPATHTAPPLSPPPLQALAKYAFGLGFLQIGVCTAAFTLMALPAGNGIMTQFMERVLHAPASLAAIRSVDEAVVIAVALSLSSSAFVLQVGFAGQRGWVHGVVFGAAVVGTGCSRVRLLDAMLAVGR